MGLSYALEDVLAAPLASTHGKPIAGDSQHTQNIQINSYVGENEKCIFYFMEKTKQTFWPTQCFMMSYNPHLPSHICPS